MQVSIERLGVGGVELERIAQLLYGVRVELTPIAVEGIFNGAVHIADRNYQNSAAVYKYRIGAEQLGIGRQIEWKYNVFKKLVRFVIYCEQLQNGLFASVGLIEQHIGDDHALDYEKEPNKQYCRANYRKGYAEFCK
jgi:hypothetical protein